MSYAAAIDSLYALGQELAAQPGSPTARKFDLAHMRALAGALGDPQRSFPSILIAGTNGKGSTAATLGSILAAAGYRTGLYTSPHLVRVTERIQISSPDAPSEYAAPDAHGSAGAGHLIPIAEADLARLYFQVDETARTLVTRGELPHPPSFFEVLTALAFLFFAEQHVEIAVLEVGLGGRLDATNIVDPLLSIITDIALDHQEYLGSTIAAITREKAGILRAGGTLITLPQHPEANAAIGEVAATLPGLRAISAAPLVPAPAPSSAETTFPARNQYTLSLEGGESLRVDSPLPGSHQQRNLALAIMAALELRHSFGYKLETSAIEAGIRRTEWPGRLESVAPNLLLDVAHNPAGAWTLRAAISGLPEHRPRTLLFSCLRDKDLEEMARILFPLFDSSSTDPARHGDHIVLAPIDSPRAAPVEDLLAAAHRLGIPAHAAPHVAGAFQQAREVTPPDGLIVATGSVYLVGAVRELALEGARR